VGVTDPLAGLEDVPWDELDIAETSEIPGLLLGVVHGDEGERDRCITHLYEQVWHQGDVYRVTTSAVPFMARIAREVSLGLTDMQRSSLVLLLGEVALATPDESLSLVSLKPRSAVAMEVEATTLALTLSGPTVRRSCVFLCAACPEAARSLVPLIEATRECVTPDREIGIDLTLALVVGTSVDALVGDASRLIAELDIGNPLRGEDPSPEVAARLVWELMVS
jgi:hypothetical protein